MSVFKPAIAAPRVALTGASISVPFKEVLDRTAPGIVFAATIGLRGASGTETLYLSDLGYTSGATETPPHTAFLPRLTQPLSYRRSTNGARIGGSALFRGGEIRFSLIDQAIEVAGTRYDRRGLTSAYSVNGQPIEVRAIPAGYTWDTGIVLSKGAARRWTPQTNGEILITLRGTAEDLDRLLMPVTYAGTGDLEGTTDLQGKRRPIALGGTSYNVSPPLVIPGELLFEVNCDASGAGAAVVSILPKIAGVPITVAADYATTALLRAASVPGGQAATCLAEGRFRLGTTPGSTVTCDVVASANASAGTLARATLQAYGPCSGDDCFVVGSFANVDAVRGYSLARWVSPDESLTGAQFMSEVANSIEGAWGDTATGQLFLVLTERPDGAAPISFGAGSVVDESWQPQDLPTGITPAVRECTVRYRRNYTPLSDIGTAVTGDERTALAQADRATTATQALALYEDGQTVEVETLIDNDADADALRDVVLGLYDGSLRMGRFNGGHRALTQRIGGKLSMDLEQEGFSDAVLRVIGLDVDCARMSVQPEVLF